MEPTRFPPHIFPFSFLSLTSAPSLTALRASALDFASGPHTAYLNIINTNRSFYYAHLTPLAAHTTYFTGTTLRVSGFDGKTTKNSDINNVLEAAGFEAGTYEILWVDGQSFYLNFAKSQLVEVSVVMCSLWHVHNSCVTSAHCLCIVLVICSSDINSIILSILLQIEHHYCGHGGETRLLHAHPDLH